jgi:hypothetical protein
MTTATADLVVMIVFGLLLGSLLKLHASISGMDRSVGNSIERARRPLSERLADTFDREKLRAENKAMLAAMPRSAWVAIGAIYGVIAMLIVVVQISPVTMRWWPFLGAVLGAYIMADLLFSRTLLATRRQKSRQNA